MCNKITSSLINPNVILEKIKNNTDIETKKNETKISFKSPEIVEANTLKDTKDISKSGKANTNINLVDDKTKNYNTSSKTTPMPISFIGNALGLFGKTDFSNKSIAMFDKIDNDKNGFISSKELLSKMNDPSIKGEDAAVIALFIQKYDDLKNLSNENNLIKKDGITKETLKELDKLPPDNLLKKDINSSFNKLKEKVDKNISLRNPDGSLKLPEKASDINYKDVTQGTIGDCYLLATLVSLAKTNPQKIKDMIKDNGDGTYNVKFSDETIKVKSPTDVELALYANGDSWVPIIEKAYAVYKNEESMFKSAANNPLKHLNVVVKKTVETIKGENIFSKKDNAYNKIGNGGFTSNVMSDLVSVKPIEKPLSSVSLDTTRNILKDIIKNNKLITASIQDSNKYGLEKKHAYAVLDYDTKTDKVTIKNPWGHGEGKLLDGEDDGIFTIPLSEFNKTFQRITYQE